MEDKKEEKKEGLRYDSDKIRYDLLEPFAIEQVARIFTKGSKKYAPHNWLKGMAWSKMRASLERHLAAYDRGEDYDISKDCVDCQEGVKSGVWICNNHTGELHIAQVAWNALGITSYYKYYPQGDDRLHTLFPKPKIGLDIDEVLADFTSGWSKIHNVAERPECWNYHRDMGKEFDKMRESGSLDEFYMSLEPKISPNDFPFEPHVYVTSRPVSSKVTEDWLEKHKFPGSKVITVPLGTSKVDVLKEAGVDIFVDDAYHNFIELNRNGVCCYLMDAPHNQRYNVGYRRIKTLKELYL